MDPAAEYFPKARDTGMNANITTCNAGIDACAESGDMDQAAEWYSRRRRLGSLLIRLTE